MTKPARQTIEPRILVLEGLFGDTAEIINDAGGDADEIAPWDIDEVIKALGTGIYTGLVLTGGSDIDPHMYGAKPHKSVYGVDQLRDSCERIALDMALVQNIPVLGICRGSQIMCAHRGGKLVQDIDGHRGTDHRVFAAPDARTFKRAIGGRDMDVVSLHHQCVKDPGEGMRIAAYAYDDTPEAIESLDGKWLGVQYHPEMAAYENANAFAIFQWLVRAAADHEGVIAPIPTFREVKRANRTWRRVATTAVKSVTGPAYSSKAPDPKRRPAGEKTRPAERPGELELHSCQECGMLFDHRGDRDDHMAFLHEGADPYMVDDAEEFAARYPGVDIEPPMGHHAWSDDSGQFVAVESDADMVRRMLAEGGE